MLDPGQWVILAGLVASILTTILTFHFQAKRESRKHQQDLEREERNRKWDLEDRQYRAEEERKDRERIAARELHESKEIAAQVIIEQANIAQLVEERLTIEAKGVLASLIAENQKAELAREKLAEMIEANTEISTQAFKEANNINRKIESLGLEQNALERERQDGSDMSQVVEDAVLDTHRKVVEIHEEVTDTEPKREE
jgi:hypothetical protein